MNITAEAPLSVSVAAANARVSAAPYHALAESHVDAAGMPWLWWLFLVGILGFSFIGPTCASQ